MEWLSPFVLCCHQSRAVKSSSEVHNTCADTSLSREALWGKRAIWREQDYFLGIFSFCFPSLHPLCPPCVCRRRMGMMGGLDVLLRVAHTGGCHSPMFQLGCGACWDSPVVSPDQGLGHCTHCSFSSQKGGSCLSTGSWIIPYPTSEPTQGWSRAPWGALVTLEKLCFHLLHFPRVKRAGGVS